MKAILAAFFMLVSAAFAFAGEPVMLQVEPRGPEDLSGCFQNGAFQGDGVTCVLPDVPASCPSASATCRNDRTGDSFLVCWTQQPTTFQACRWGNFWCDRPPKCVGGLGEQ